MFFWRRRRRDEAEPRTPAHPLAESSQRHGGSGSSASLGARSVRLERDEPRRACPSCGKVVKLYEALCTSCGTELDYTDDVIPPESAMVQR